VLMRGCQDSVQITSAPILVDPGCEYLAGSSRSYVYHVLAESLSLDA
jgi:hypothetical protein